MTRTSLLLSAVLAGLVGFPDPGRAGDQAATWSFGAGDNATVAGAITTAGGKIAVDLSALPKGAEVFRAVLRMARDAGPGRQHESDAVAVCPSDQPDKPLELLPPRYASLDATAAVAAAVKGGAGKVEFAVKGLSGWKQKTTRLDVSFTGGAAKNAMPKVANVVARGNNGQSIITWTDPAPPTTATELTFKEWKDLNSKLGKEPRQVRFRIYRFDQPITPGNVAKAELVDEVGQFTCWNPDYYGVYPGDGDKLPRYVVQEGKDPVASDTGIYAHNPAKAGRACYAVSVAVNGEEDLTAFSKDNATPSGVDEIVGPGDPVKQSTQNPAEFFYTKDITLDFYVRWEAPPRCNLPSRPYDYVVILGSKLAKPAPLNLILHCWGSNFLGKGGAYRWFGWSDRQIGIGVASNQVPYDWWTCYHENLGTWKPWTAGVTRDFTSKRLNAFVDWVTTKHDVDKTRLCVSGESMGGSGSTFAPIRYGERYAYAFSAVGIHNPAAIKGRGFYESYAGYCGELDAKIKHESGMLTFDYLNDPLLVRRDPKANLPFIGFGNGKNDGGIGWTHVVDLAKAFQEARQPHAVIWNMGGHGAGTWYPADIVFRNNQSLPAFTRCSLDSDIGTANPLAEPREVTRGNEKFKDTYDGDSTGQINTFLRWKTDDITDTEKEYGLTVMLEPKAPKDDCTVNVTPRRLQKFAVKPGAKFKWSAAAVGGAAGTTAPTGPFGGTVEADKDGLITLEKLAVTKAGVRIKLVPAE